MGISCIYLKNMYFLFCWLYGPDGVFAFQIWRCTCALKVLTTSESHIQGQHAKKHSACGQSLMWARTYTHTVNPGKEGIYWIWGHKHRGGVWGGSSWVKNKGKTNRHEEEVPASFWTEQSHWCGIWKKHTTMLTQPREPDRKLCSFYNKWPRIALISSVNHSRVPRNFSCPVVSWKLLFLPSGPFISEKMS